MIIDEAALMGVGVDVFGSVVGVSMLVLDMIMVVTGVGVAMTSPAVVIVRMGVRFAVRVCRGHAVLPFLIGRASSRADTESSRAW